MRIVVIASSFIVSAFAAYFLIGQLTKTSWGTPSATEIEWNKLAELDYVSGQASDTLKALDGKMVRIPGFMVPLEDEQKNVTEFLLVPTAQACIHVPPPPPNQMVLVKMKKEDGVSVQYGPIWAYGILRLTSKQHLYGESSFELEGTLVEQFKF